MSPDPLDELLEADARRDEALARGRGERLFTLAEAVVSDLVATGYLPARWTGPARVHCFSVLADGLFGNAAIEIPRRLGSRRPDERTES